MSKDLKRSFELFCNDIAVNNINLDPQRNFVKRALYFNAYIKSNNLHSLGHFAMIIVNDIKCRADTNRAMNGEKRINEARGRSVTSESTM